ncbi:cytoglobin-2 isoform X2 [Esox lucius]|uniref:cytoglobin-2 isoform X2 n=1 Tax=Esox lucius TaxID=8010 RepID=UPI0014776FFD|nr:cytoglobin-2 isoform X2 [Esox lucius]
MELTFDHFRNNLNVISHVCYCCYCSLPEMGCAISGLIPKQVMDVKEDVPIVHLTVEHKELIKDTWKVIQENIAKVGIIMFVGLFETHPECKDVFFLFRDVEDLERLRYSKELKTHGLRIMHFIEKSVARLHQTERLDQMILDLGKGHCRYSAPPKYYMVKYSMARKYSPSSTSVDERSTLFRGTLTTGSVIMSGDILGAHRASLFSI